MSCGEKPPGFGAAAVGRRPRRGDFRGTMPATHSSTLVKIEIETDDGSLEARLHARNKAETDNGSLEVLQRQRQNEAMASQSSSQTKSSLAGNKNASPGKDPYKRVRADATKVASPGVNASNTAQHLRPCKKSKGLGEHGNFDDNQGSTEVRRPQTPINLFEDECVFCHSFRTSEKLHGPIVMYRKGRIVSSDEGNLNDAIYVHKKCMNWAPRVYLDGDKIVNMEKEISRSKRLKCSRCRLPGAALGCYHDPCPQNYHVPCAVMIIPDYGWDMKNLHVWCPKHASNPLPCDVTSSVMESGITSRILENHCSDKEGLSTDYQREEKLTNQSRTLVNQWVLLGSILSASEKDSLNEFASLTNSTLAEECNKNVTHVIVGKSAGIKCGRSYEVLMAILCGKWVVRAGWIVDCLAKQIPGSKTCLAGPITVPEISYEVEFFDASHISIDGPRKARAGAAEGAPKLFSGLHFCLSACMDPELRENIENLIAAAQGKVQEAQENVGKNSSKVYFICDGSPPRDSTDKVIEEAEKYAAWGAQVTCHLWLFDAIASYDARMLEWSYREARKMLLGVDFSKC